MLHIVIFLRPLRYLEPGTGSILIQLILAALGGGLFFFIKSKWNSWFKKGKNKPKSADDIEENVEDGDAPSAQVAKQKQSSGVKAGTKVKGIRSKSTSRKTKSSGSKKRK